jgi:lipid-A-disaccharide synthase
MDRPPQKILIIAGEESGDMRAAALVHAIKALRPDVQFTGIGGERCRKEGVKTFTDITELAVIGFTEVIKNIGRIKRVFDLALEHARIKRPDLAILVDYPGFNLRLAKELKKLNIKVIYYVSPQIWAWKESRVEIIKRVVDRMLVLFPFERDLYTRHGYKADFVGHPLVDEVHANTPRDIFLKNIGLDPRRPVLGLLPGSRPKEASRHLPAMLQAAQLVQKEQPDVQIILLKAKNLDSCIFSDCLTSAPAGTKISEDYYNALNACDAAIVCSGTATLETGLMTKPMVVVYKTSWLTWFIGRMVIKIPCIALVNIVAGKKLAEELLQNNASPEAIAEEILKLLEPPRALKVRQDLSTIKTILGASGASKRAAAIVMDELTRTYP